MHRFFLNIENEKTYNRSLSAYADKLLWRWEKKMDPFETLTEEIDSLTATPDTTEAMAAVEEEPMVPATADESFADFFYNFASDENYNCHASCSLCRIIQWKRKSTLKRSNGNTILYSAGRMPIQFCSIRQKTWKWRKIRV